MKKKEEEEGFAIENFCVWGGAGGVQQSGQAAPMGGPRKQFELLPRKDTWVASKKRQAGGQSVPWKVKNKRRERSLENSCMLFLLLRIQFWMSSSCQSCK